MESYFAWRCRGDTTSDPRDDRISVAGPGRTPRLGLGLDRSGREEGEQEKDNQTIASHGNLDERGLAGTSRWTRSW